MSFPAQGEIHYLTWFGILKADILILGHNLIPNSESRYLHFMAKCTCFRTTDSQINGLGGEKSAFPWMNSFCGAYFKRGFWLNQLIQFPFWAYILVAPKNITKVRSTWMIPKTNSCAVLRMHFAIRLPGYFLGLLSDTKCKQLSWAIMNHPIRACYAIFYWLWESTFEHRDHSIKDKIFWQKMELYISRTLAPHICEIIIHFCWGKFNAHFKQSFDSIC